MPTAKRHFRVLRHGSATLAMGCLLTGSAWAHSAPPTESGTGQQKNWLDEIAVIEAETTILQKREELDTRSIEAQTRVLQKQEELEELVRETTAKMLAHLPSVVAITGMDGNYQSQLHYPSGRLAYVRVGEQIMPDVKVVAISLSKVEVDVTLGRDRQQRRLALDFISLPERRIDLPTDGTGTDTRQQVNAARDVVMPGVPGQAGAGGETAAVINVLRALAGTQAGAQ